MRDLTFLNILQTWYTKVITNVTGAASKLTIHDYIRLVWIIGGYFFLRPYLDKGFRKLFEKSVAEFDKEETQVRVEADHANGATLSANGLRGGQGEENSEGYEQADSSAVSQWGKSARRKQQKFMERLEQEAEKRKENDDDKDIEDLLED